MLGIGCEVDVTGLGSCPVGVCVCVCVCGIEPLDYTNRELVISGFAKNK
jgi:hypothetical protein